MSGVVCSVSAWQSTAIEVEMMKADLTRAEQEAIALRTQAKRAVGEVEQLKDEVAAAQVRIFRQPGRCP